MISKALELWQFVAEHLLQDECVILLVVAESSGSSPGRAGYKMAVAADGELCGSIGGGVMEVRLAELAKVKSKRAEGRNEAELVEQIHRKDIQNSSGMICSGRQTIIVKPLTTDHLETVQRIIVCLENRESRALEISNLRFQMVDDMEDHSPQYFTQTGETEFVYRERLGYKHDLFIVGGGHCSLALSELMSKLDFRISIFDDRPSLNTIAKNQFADRVTIVDSYQDIAAEIPSSDNVYVVVMTLGYASDAVVIQALIDHKVKYFGVLGSEAKMKTLMKELRDQGVDSDKLARIRTPIGLPINSQTPEEIAVSIAAEIVAVRNSR